MVTGTLGELQEAVGGLTVPPVSADVVELFGLRERVEVTVLETLAGFFATGGHDVDGFRSAVGWLKAHVALADGDAKALAVRAQRLAVWPVLAKLLFDGSLAAAQVAVIVSAVPRDLVGLFADHDEEISLVLVGLCVGDTRKAIDRWVGLARDTKDTSDDPVDPTDTRADGFVHLSRYGADDRGRLDGDLGPDATAVVDSALIAADAALTAARNADGADDTGPRVGSERRADALVEVCRFYNAHVDCETPKRARTPQLMALIELGDLYRAALYGLGIHDPAGFDRLLTRRRRAGQPVSAVEEGFLRDALDHATGQATTIDGHRLSPEAVTTIFGAGTTLERVMLADSHVVDHGRQVRLATGPLRDAMLARDGGCRFPTPTGERCDAPVAWINGHHVQHWRHGGPTSLRNLLTLCSTHHGVVHRDGWDITIDTQGAVTVTRPDGTTLTSSPPHTRRPPQLPLHRDSDHADLFEAALGHHGPTAERGPSGGDDRPSPTDESEGDGADPGVCGYTQTRLSLTVRLREARTEARTPKRMDHTDGSVVDVVGRLLRPARRAEREAAPDPRLGAGPSSSEHPSGPTAARLRSIRDHVHHAPTSHDDGNAPALHQLWSLGRGRRQGSRAPDLITRTSDGTPVAVYVTAA